MAEGDDPAALDHCGRAHRELRARPRLVVAHVSREADALDASDHDGEPLVGDALKAPGPAEPSRAPALKVTEDRR